MLFGNLYASDPYAVKECFWDMEASGRSDSPAGIGLSTEQMKTRKVFTAAGWDFEGVWEVQEGAYPALRNYWRN